MDGLMIDSEAPVQACCQAAAAETGFTLDDEFYVSALLGRGWEDCYASLTSHFGPRFPLAEFLNRFSDKWNQHLLAGIAVKPGLHELLELLRTKRVPTAIATSTHLEEARASLASAGITHTFDAFVTGDQVRRGKPHPQIHLTAA